MKTPQIPNNNPSLIKNLLCYFLIGMFLVTGIFLSSRIAWDDIQSPNKKIFELNKAGTWNDIRSFWGGIVSSVGRMFIVENFDTVLPTKEAWREFQLDFKVVNPRDFGLVYHYQNEGNYDFLAVFVESQALIWGTVENSIPRWSGREKKPLDYNQSFRFKINAQEANLCMGDQVITSRPIDSLVGKAGLMIMQTGESRTQLEKISLSGINKSGKIIKIPYINKDSWNVPFSALILYSFIVGLIYYIKGIVQVLCRRKQINFLQIYPDFLRLPIQEKVFYILAYSGGALFFTRLMQIAVWFRWNRLFDAEGWQIFMLSLSVYLIILLAAVLYRRLWNILNVPVLFIGFLFTLYAVSLLNSMIFKIDDFIFIRICFAGAYLPIVIKFFRSKKSKNEETKVQTRAPFLNILIGLWLMYAMLYSFEYNFHKYRYPHTDEQNLWFLAANDSVELGLKKMGQAVYPSGRTHAYGVPFIAALPALFWNQKFAHMPGLTDGIGTVNDLGSVSAAQFVPWNTPGFDSPRILFFLPLTVMISLFFFLMEIKRFRWCFIFFYLGLFFSFDFNWIGHLIYRSMYAEGLALIFFLSLIYSMWLGSDKKDLKTQEVILLSFFMGLIALCKVPVGYFTIVFAVLLIIMMKYFKRPVRIQMVILTAAVIPFVIWKWYTFSGHFTEINIQQALQQPEAMHFKGEMMSKVFEYIGANYQGMIIFSVLSFVLIFAFGGVIEKFLLIPIISLIVFVLIYYGWIFSGVDHESALRYISSQLLALYFLGGVSLEKGIVKKFENSLN